MNKKIKEIVAQRPSLIAGGIIAIVLIHSVGSTHAIATSCQQQSEQLTIRLDGIVVDGKEVHAGPLTSLEEIATVRLGFYPLDATNVVRGPLIMSNQFSLAFTGEAY